MSLKQSEATSSGVWGAVQGALKLFQDINKAKGVTENQNPTPIDQYESSYTEEEVVSLVGQWKQQYNSYYSEVEPSQNIAFSYWIGKQGTADANDTGVSQMLIDNKIFEAVETFIPIATRANPDPLVQADPSLMGQRLARDLKQALVSEADRQKLRKILKRLLRHWLIYRIGILKVSYNIVLDQIETNVIIPKRMVFDKDGTWDESGFFTGEYIGEKKKATASTLIKLFPKKKQEILQEAGGKYGTKIEYFEWWYRKRDVFFTMNNIVLGKFKNPHWNYDVPATDAGGPVSGEPPEEETVEQPPQPSQPGVNHFKEPQYPYIGLSIFSTGLQPHDETSLILQNVGLQDMINRRMQQIDKNVDSMNNGIVVDSTFTDAQASQAASALRRGTAIRVPGNTGGVGDHVQRFPAPPLPADVFQQMVDGRNELRNIFGTAGSSPEGVNNQDTVRGKILVNQLDSSRIGGGVTEYLEQVADTTYNWWVQMMFVHYTDEHYIVSAGIQAGQEIISLKNSAFTLVKTLNITVKEGSLIPKDPLTQRNEAIDLWSAGAIDPESLFTRLEFADPHDATKKLLMWQLVQKGVLPPQMYIPDFPTASPQMMMQDMQGMGGQMMPPPGVGGPAVNPLDASASMAQFPPTSNEAVSAESRQLMNQIPV